MEINNKRIAVIGAGISGLTIAEKLGKKNEVIVFDKSRGIGGRMTTKRTDDYHFDHGAQYFTAQTDDFKELCKEALEADIIEEWNAKIVEINSNKINDAGAFDNNKKNYVAKPQMNNLCKYLARKLNILLKKQINSIHFEDKKWYLKTTQNEIFDNFDYLILAIPSHQAINLLPQNFEYFDIVNNIKMLGCFTLMLGFKNNLNLNFDAAFVKNSVIDWICVNSSKPQRPAEFSLIINSTNDWAQDNIEKDLDIAKETLLSSLKDIIDFDSNDIDYENIHRWRYANVAYRKGEKSLFDKKLNLGICGDWLISGKVENAFLSGLDLHNNITKNG